MFQNTAFSFNQKTQSKKINKTKHLLSISMVNHLIEIGIIKWSNINIDLVQRKN